MFVRFWMLVLCCMLCCMFCNYSCRKWCWVSCKVGGWSMVILISIFSWFIIVSSSKLGRVWFGVRCDCCFVIVFNCVWRKSSVGLRVVLIVVVVWWLVWLVIGWYCWCLGWCVGKVLGMVVLVCLVLVLLVCRDLFMIWWWWEW